MVNYEMRNSEKRSVLVWSGQNMIYAQSMLKICIYTGINADVSLDDAQTKCEDRARILKQNSQ